MKVQDVAKLIGAQIGDKETVAGREIESVTLDAAAAEAGDLCFAEELEEVQQASANGATAIVCPQKFHTEVEEGNCLYVQEVFEAALRLAGNLVGEEKSAVEYLTPKELTYLRMIMTHKKSVAFLPERWQDAFEMVMSGAKPLIMTDNMRSYHSLRPQKRPFSDKATGYVVSADSLFRTTFKIEKYIYQYKQFPHFHLSALQRAIALCQKYEIPYTLDRIGYTHHFKPIFLEGEPSVQEVMKNEKVVILSDNLEDILEARAYASDVGNWMAKTIVMVPPKTAVEGVKYPTYYRSTEEIIELIGTLHYNYLFIYTEETSLQQRIEMEYM